MKIKQLTQSELIRHNGRSFFLPFCLITICFMLWGFANGLNQPFGQAFSKIFILSSTEGAVLQVAFFLWYFCMAIPAALYIQRRTYKDGVKLGLILFATGALLFFPARFTSHLLPYLIAGFVLAGGLVFLEVSCNPYIYSLGTEQTAVRRLNLAQAFNPIGALLGMYVATQVLAAHMSPLSAADRQDLSVLQFEALKSHDLAAIAQPFVAIALVAIALLVGISFYTMPTFNDKSSKKMTVLTAFRELSSLKNYREGFIAQFFYVGAQVGCWTFIFRYGLRIFQSEGMEDSAAEMLTNRFALIAVIAFTLFRFVCTWLLRYVKPARLLAVMAILAGALLIGVIEFHDRSGLYCLIGVSACMSLMFPTIFGISLYRAGNNLKMAGAGLVMASIGGFIIPMLQALIINSGIMVLGINSVNFSYIIPLICFCVVAVYGHRAYVRMHITHTM